jgi:hypothetical protein
MRRTIALVVLAAACGGPHSAAPPDAAPGDDAGPQPPDAGGPHADPLAALAAMPAQCSADHWCWRDPKPTGNDYDHVYATSDDNIWLIGQHGTVLQWDGAAWRAHHPAVLAGQAAAQFSMSISGRSASDMWLIYGTAVEHWDGAAWTIKDTAPTNGSVGFDNVWEAPNGDVWVTLSNGTLSRSLGGGDFQRIDTGCGCFLGNIWGLAADDFWMTSLPGNILHSDGKTFTRSFTGTTPVGAILGTATDDIWVSGAAGTLLHWNGTAWKPVASGHTEGFLDRAGARARDDVWWWIGADLVHWDGTAITTTTIDTTIDTTGATTGATSQFTDAGLIGGRWWLVGYGGAVSTLTGGKALQPVVQTSMAGMQSMWGSADSDLYFATGGEIFHWDGATTTPLPVTARRVTGVRTDGVDELFAGGYRLSDDRTRYVALGFHYDGAAWTTTELDVAPFAQNRYFEAIWPLGPGEAIAVGGGGLAYHHASGAWSPIATGVTANLAGVWGPDPDHVYITGAQGTLLRWDRAKPTVATPDPTLDASLIPVDPIHGTPLDLGPISGAGDRVWVGMPISSDLLTYDGTRWTVVHAGVPAGGLLALDATHAVVSSPGQSLLARWDGTAWTPEDIASGTTMPVLFQPPGGPLLAGGLGGLVEHR